MKTENQDFCVITKLKPETYDLGEFDEMNSKLDTEELYEEIELEIR